MKRFVKASQSNEVIFEDEFFAFIKISGVGRNNTFWRGLTVKSKGLAEKHVIEVRLSAISDFSKPFDGTPVIYDYNDVYVSQGMRSVTNTLDETEEVIEVLQDAVDFSYKVIDWMRDNDYSI